MSNNNDKAHKYFLRSGNILGDSDSENCLVEINSIENEFPVDDSQSIQKNIEKATASTSNDLNLITNEKVNESNQISTQKTISIPPNLIQGTDFDISLGPNETLLVKTSDPHSNSIIDNSEIFKQNLLSLSSSSSSSPGELSCPIELNNPDTNNQSKMGEKEINYKYALLSIPKYDGNSESLNQFIRCCELITNDLKKEEFPKFLSLMNTLLVGKANDVIKLNEFDSWDDLKQELESRFSCPKSVQQIQSELSLIKQSATENVQEFANKIEILLSQLNSACVKSEGEESAKLLKNFNSKLALSSFKNGLHNESIKLLVKSGRFESFREAVREALEEEALVSSQVSVSNNHSKRPVNPNKCQLCGIVGHLGNSCRRFQVTPLTPYSNSNSTNFYRPIVSSFPSQNRVFNNQSQILPSSDQNSPQKLNRRPVICAYCKNPGHVIADCRKRQYNNSRNLSSTAGHDNNVTVITQSNPENFQQLEMPSTSASLRVQDILGTQN